MISFADLRVKEEDPMRISWSGEEVAQLSLRLEWSESDERGGESSSALIPNTSGHS